MRTILVTGGCGFIGSNFIHYVLDKYPDHNIINFDCLTYAGNPKNLEDIKLFDRYRFYKIDISNEGDVDDIAHFINPDIIINFAAESHVDRSINSSKSFIKTNIEGTRVLLDVARKRWKIKKFVQISTDEVYGQLGEIGKFKETDILNASSPYSASKASADLIVLSYYKTHGFPVVITRCSNNYGIYQYPEKLIPLLITNAIEKKQLPIYGDGKNVRDWINVIDHCRAIDVVMNYGKFGEIYNVGGGNEKQNIEIAEFIIDYLKLDKDIIEFVEDRKGHDWRYAIDYSKLNNDFGWKPLCDFEEGLRDTIDWYRRNTAWWKELKEIKK